ncbi:MAG: alpha/beta hydrolase domain-containing protein, partial [Acidimicrobiia bacterium]
YSFDMFTQVARTARAGGAPLGNAKVQHVIAAGESQSAFALVTYVNGVQPITHAFDGFFVHSRGAVGLGLVGPGKSADIAGAIAGTASIFRTDTTVPIMDVQAETDVGGVLRSAAARQPDSKTFRLWEVPGTAHADRHLMGAVADSLDCGAPINDGPLHVVTKAAFHALQDWVDAGTLPRQAPRLTTTGADNSQISRDADGIALGGVRTPPVDVPVEVLSGVPGPKQSTICLLLGSTQPLSAARLAALYPNRAAYTTKFGKALATAITQGYVLAADRVAMQAYAHPEKVAG